MMHTFRSRKLGLFALALILIFVLAGTTSGLLGASKQSSSESFKLAPPEFLTSARAQTPDVIADRLDAEAGISAYFHSTDPINLTNAATAFRVIETQTADYIIGSVPVSAYIEHYDAHVYVNTNGWIMAYYMRDEPISKIIDIRHLNIASTNLHSVVATVAGASGVPFTGVTYYDFRYPNATHILMVYEDEASGNDFSITIPSSYGYYERGFATRGYYGGDFFNLDGVNLPTTFYVDDSAGSTYDHGYGTITASQFLPDIEHTISVNDYGVLIIVYREQ